MSMDLGDNLSMKYKQLCFQKFATPNNTMMNSLKFGEIVMSIDSLLNSDPKPLTLALNTFCNISLVSIYSQILSSEEIDIINVTQLTDEQERKLKKTIRQLNTFKKKKKRAGLSTSTTTDSKSSKGKNKIVTDLDNLLSCDTIENNVVFKALSKNLTVTRNMRFLQLCALRLSKKSWSGFADAISENKTVKILSLNA